MGEDPSTEDPANEPATDPASLGTSARDSKKVPYLRYAFHNVYNYGVLGGLAATSLLTHEWWMGVVGVGAEALWLLFAPDSGLLRKLWFDKVHAGRVKEAMLAERQRLVASLPPTEAARVTAVEAQRARLLKLRNDNTALTQGLLGDEIQKIDRLTESFVELAVSARRYENYLESIDLNQVEKDLRSYPLALDRSKDPKEREIIGKNLAVLMKRRERLIEIKQYVTQAYGQMKLIENTFALLGDQMVTMRSPAELGGQLDDLMSGVEAVRTAARETEAIMQANG